MPPRDKTSPETPAETALAFPGAAPDLATVGLEWLSRLVGERRMSAHTIEAYARDVRQFIAFMADHFGQPPDLACFADMAPADIRAFMARRRADGVESRSLLRMMAGVRSFARHMERTGRGKAAAFSAIRAPKIARTLPKPARHGRSPATRRCFHCFTARASASPRPCPSADATRPWATATA